jgi:hypothetical protein
LRGRIALRNVNNCIRCDCSALQAALRLRANGICNTLGRGATVISPFVVGPLMMDYRLPGVIWLMIGPLMVQIIAVYFWGVEPARRPLEGLDPKV